jgi:DHA2 family multidrug resistance protein
MITATVMLATSMQALDTTIANFALPYMQGSLSATSDEINWVLTSYIVAAAIITPATGWLEAKFGRNVDRDGAGGSRRVHRQFKS